MGKIMGCRNAPHRRRCVGKRRHVVSKSDALIVRWAVVIGWRGASATDSLCEQRTLPIPGRDETPGVSTRRKSLTADDQHSVAKVAPKSVISSKPLSGCHTSVVRTGRQGCRSRLTTSRARSGVDRAVERGQGPRHIGAGAERFNTARHDGRRNMRGSRAYAVRQDRQDGGRITGPSTSGEMKPRASRLSRDWGTRRKLCSQASEKRNSQSDEVVASATMNDRTSNVRGQCPSARSLARRPCHGRARSVRSPIGLRVCLRLTAATSEER